MACGWQTWTLGNGVCLEDAIYPDCSLVFWGVLLSILTVLTSHKPICLGLKQMTFWSTIAALTEQRLIDVIGGNPSSRSPIYVVHRLDR
jgi:hypothetical protein